MAKGPKQSMFVGDEFTSKVGEKYTIVDYKCAVKGVTIQFESTGNMMVCSAKEVRNGAVKNCLQKSVYGAGYFGEGPYKAKVGGKFTPEYQLWIGVMGRVYNEEILKVQPAYRGVTICDEWLNFQNFASWCNEQVSFDKKEHNGRRFMLDKDLLIPDNRTYRPEACCFLPHVINVALQGRQRDKTTALPSGVYWHNASNGYIAAGQKFGKQHHLGCFADPVQATGVFRAFKKQYLAELADVYASHISSEAYQALVDFNLYERTIYDTAGA